MPTNPPPEFVEEDRVVAFIDVLGFREVMQSADTERRQHALQLLHRIGGYGSSHGVNVQNLGFAASITLSAEVTTFSDNVVLSFPTSRVSFQSLGGTRNMPAHEFFGQLINSIISIYWQGLHLGLLFRGGITFGRLYHDSKVVAGEALVRAVLLEKETRWPRIELEPCLIAQKDVDGNPMLDEFLREVAVVEHEGRYFLNTLAFHQGVWWDYNHFRKGDPAVTSREIIQAVENIKNSIMDRITMLEKRISSQGHVADNSSEYEALLKWRWFQSEFDEAQEHEIWRTVRQQAEQESKG